MTKTLLTTVFIALLSTASTQNHHSGMNHSAAGANHKELKDLSGKAFDRAFLSMMIPHHEAAVDMSKAVLPTTKSAQVKAWAQAIIKAQNTEITLMKRLLTTHGGSDKAMATQMNSMMAGMVKDVHTASNRDRAFAKGMIPHHASAIEMASHALKKSKNPTILKLARDIVSSQTKEINQFRAYLK
ncbi:DUF305 domain-containing protein [Deinococcus deserti]|uniref:DUF305 domain-containing protein n=1 Tax=Deinococcus deserti (strain DSM 17065 / CIP 109153 / LMG 22923 / VCD115) TaxID=546414 RepID=C1D2Y6_DEIDV|nr:DUF305 domain-containing protein [Deinococcus deserti]ACO47775.1 hypothetical protein Deide_2p01090 [Deinococcus deserti VCD115]